MDEVIDQMIAGHINAVGLLPILHETMIVQGAMQSIPLHLNEDNIAIPDDQCGILITAIVPTIQDYRWVGRTIVEGTMICNTCTKIGYYVISINALEPRIDKLHVKILPLDDVMRSLNMEESEITLFKTLVQRCPKLIPNDEWFTLADSRDVFLWKDVQQGYAEKIQPFGQLYWQISYATIRSTLAEEHRLDSATEQDMKDKREMYEHRAFSILHDARTPTYATLFDEGNSKLTSDSSLEDAEAVISPLVLHSEDSNDKPDKKRSRSESTTTPIMKWLLDVLDPVSEYHDIRVKDSIQYVNACLIMPWSQVITKRRHPC
jgi:hypothetical protein